MGNGNCCKTERANERVQTLVLDDHIEKQIVQQDLKNSDGQIDIKASHQQNAGSESQRLTKASSKGQNFEELILKGQRPLNNFGSNLLNDSSFDDFGQKFSFQTLNSQQKLPEFTSFVTFQALPSSNTIKPEFTKLQQQYQNEMKQLQHLSIKRGNSSIYVKAHYNQNLTKRIFDTKFLF